MIGRVFPEFAELNVALPGEWWNSKADGGPREQAAYAYWTAWKCALSGAAAERKRFGDLLNAEMEKGGHWAGNFAVALGLLGDVRACGILRSLVATPGASHPAGSDPVVARAYPNRIKAICLLGRFGDKASIPLLRDVVLGQMPAHGRPPGDSRMRRLQR